MSAAIPPPPQPDTAPSPLSTGEPVAWQSIETAPRDGRRILACGGGLERVEIVSYNGIVGCWDAEAYTLDDRDDDAEGYNRPALWRPVPVASTPPQPDTAPSPLSTGEVIEALDNSQSLLVMLIQIGDSSEGSPKHRPDGITRDEWETEGLTKLLVDQISENRAALSQPPATEQIRREVIEKIIKKMIRSGELPEYRTYDDCGLEVGEYVDLICKVSALALLQTESKA